LQSEIEEQKKVPGACSCCCSHGSYSSKSSASGSTREVGAGVSGGFPLVLALAATAGAMTSSSEMEKSNIVDPDNDRKVGEKNTKLDQLETMVRMLQEKLHEKDIILAKLQVMFVLFFYINCWYSKYNLSVV